MIVMLQALIVAKTYHIAWALPQLLARAGLCADILCSCRMMRRSRLVRSYLFVEEARLIEALRERIGQQHYDWVIVTEDHFLQAIAGSDLSCEDKLRILPVQSEKDFIHLFSKTGLAKVFAAGHVRAPAFSLAHNRQELLVAANQVGYPLLIKVDSSAGGCGVFPIDTPAELASFDDRLFKGPLLVQQRIQGVEWDLSAIYFEGRLVYFSCSRIEARCTAFGISSLRTYYPLSRVKEEIFQELAHIGQVLGANGFAMIGCIEADGKRYYFEADMRPNVWVEFPRFFQEDPAIYIRNWFMHKTALSYPAAPKPHQPQEILLPYFLRIKRRHLLCNRYGVWKFIKTEDPRLLMYLLQRRFLHLGLKRRLSSLCKQLVVRNIRASLAP